MQIKNIKIRDCSSDGYNSETDFGSNCVRLSAYEWMFVGIFISILVCFGPRFWGRIEKFEPEPDYRIPYELSYDYRLYENYSRMAGERHEIFVIGDSVVWGHFVSEDETLSAHLNKIAGSEKIANLGVDGIHPAALLGLLKYYGGDISDSNVILHFNPLWMSSKKNDLQTDKEYRFNHPRLVPQFVPKIPCYKATFSKKVTTIIERNIPFLNLISHLKIAYFESMDLPVWTLEHPYKNPFSVLTFKLPTSVDNNREENPTWNNRGITQQDFQWVDLDSSLQWRFFRQTIELLQKRRNKVFVLVGPFNEHVLVGGSVDVYQKIKGDIQIWLQQNNIPYYIPQTLPSEMYADASHPLSEGYAILAQQLFESPYFKITILSSNDLGRALNFAASDLR